MATSKITGKTFGTATVEYGEDPRGALICHATGTGGEIFTASRSWDGIAVAIRAATMGDYSGTDTERVGIAVSWDGEASQEQAVVKLMQIETEAQISRLWRDGDLTEEQAEELYDTLGHLPMIATERDSSLFDLYAALSQRTFAVARAAKAYRRLA